MFSIHFNSIDSKFLILILHAQLRFSNQGAYSERFLSDRPPGTGGGTHPALEAQRSLPIRQSDQLIPQIIIDQHHFPMVRTINFRQRCPP